MDVAKAMALGGEILHADDCDYCSYINLGLRCLVCGEPFFLRVAPIENLILLT